MRMAEEEKEKKTTRELKTFFPRRKCLHLVLCIIAALFRIGCISGDFLSQPTEKKLLTKLSSQWLNTIKCAALRSDFFPIHKHCEAFKVVQFTVHSNESQLF